MIRARMLDPERTEEKVRYDEKAMATTVVRMMNIEDILAPMYEKITRKSMISIFADRPELFKQFLVSNFSFSAWKRFYEDVMELRAMSGENYEISKKLEMPQRYVKFVIAYATEI